MAGLAMPSDGDLRALMAVIDDGLRDEPGEAMPWAVLDGLLRLVTCDVAVFNDINLAEQQAITVHAVEAGGLHLLEVGENFGPVYPQYWAHRQRFLPSDYTDRSGDVVTPLVRLLHHIGAEQHTFLHGVPENAWGQVQRVRSDAETRSGSEPQAVLESGVGTRF